MSFPDVQQRGSDFLSEYPRESPIWNPLSRALCLSVVGASKAFVYSFYKPQIFNLENLDKALEKSQTENRGLLTVMNHMSVVDDPFLWGVLPFKYYKSVDSIRWGLGASNVCFTSKILSYFFSLGKVLSTERFGRGPFQGSIDAAIRILSPDDSMLLDSFTQSFQETLNEAKIKQVSSSGKKYVDFSKSFKEQGNLPIVRSRPSWFHIFPEGFVLQLESPFSNSMRYFKWGISRLILESSVAPIVLPMFTYGFEKVAPESAAESLIGRYLPQNFGAEINIRFGNPMDDSVIEKFRSEWKELVAKYYDPNNPFDLSDRLKYGKEAEELRSRVAATVREAVAEVRARAGLAPEDLRFKEPSFWERYTKSEGESDKDVKFIGKNWAVKRFQKSLQKDE